MRIIRNVLTSANLLFAAAIATGIFFPQARHIGEFLILPSLTIILTVTLLRFPRGFFRPPASLIPGAVWGNVMTYVVLGNLIILGSLFIIREEILWIGMVLAAAVPPGITIIPLSRTMNTDSRWTFSGLAGAHLGALLITPIIALAFFRHTPVQPDKIILLILALIALPLLLSRVAVDKDRDVFIERYEADITDGCFFLIFYTLTAANMEYIREWPAEIILIGGIACSTIVLITAIVTAIGWFFKISPPRISFFLLFGTLKNYGLAGGVALLVFAPAAALPALIFSVFTVIYVTALKIIYDRIVPPDDGQQ
jgi:BASS family bile acid:Na+ symporter